MSISLPHNALFGSSHSHSVIDSIYDFDWALLEIPLKNCIVVNMPYIDQYNNFLHCCTFQGHQDVCA